jgi:ADP-ribose pyrophosphatase YjhB (NUDIX family)
MDDQLTAFLARHTPEATEDLVWGDRMRLFLTAYLSQEMPPLSYLTSAKAVVIRDGSVLVQRDRDSRHILPGGRLEEKELLEAALRREIGEETGWSLGKVAIIGFMHFLHLDQKPPDYRYPYPGFLQVVYAAEALAYSPEIMVEDGYEIDSGFVPVSDVRRMDLTPKEMMYLDAALKRNGIT